MATKKNIAGEKVMETGITEKDITVIIPVHVWDEDTIKPMLYNAVQSCPNGVNIMIAVAEGIKVDVADIDKKTDNYTQFTVTGDTSFPHMVNEAIKEVKTTWFSILEFDDEYSPLWLPSFIKYQKYNQQYNFFMFLNDLYNQEGGKDEFVGNGNEVAWAASFSDEAGVIDEAATNDYFNYYLTGCIFNTEAWNNLGGLKEGIKLTFWYEWILRATHKGEKLYVIPKVGYAHVLGRDGSLLDTYRKTIDQKESDFWYRIARKEYFYDVDTPRGFCYDPKKEV